ncbi:MAG: hypothetical protein ACFB4J_00765 [Elainellaceae cyanobacterium]
MYISNLEYMNTLAQDISIAGGELPPEIQAAIDEKRSRLRATVNFSFEAILSRSEEFSNTVSVRSRSGGSFSQTRIVAPSMPDVTGVVIEATAPV